MTEHKYEALVTAGAALLLASACATPSYGRVAPLVDVEREYLDCEAVQYEYAKASGFCGQVMDNGFDGDDCAAGLAIAFIPIVGLVHNAIQASDRQETFAAIKSGSIRSAQLGTLATQKGCTIDLDTRCPTICKRGTTTSVLTMENGFCGLRCTVLNRKERRTYSDLIPD